MLSPYTWGRESCDQGVCFCTCLCFALRSGCSLYKPVSETWESYSYIITAKSKLISYRTTANQTWTLMTATVLQVAHAPAVIPASAKTANAKAARKVAAPAVLQTAPNAARAVNVQRDVIPAVVASDLLSLLCSVSEV